MWPALMPLLLAIVAVPPLRGDAAEEFLRTAEVVGTEAIPVGVTDPRRVRLENGSRTARGVFKTIDEYRPVLRLDDGGAPMVDFRDSFRSEIAAYELDKLLGLGMVPPTVARRIGRERGSLQLWIEDCMTEGERLERGAPPPDREAWNRQMHTVRLFHQLIGDRDYKNVSNLLVDPDFRIWIVDHSRAFPVRGRLLGGAALERFSVRLLERLEGLTREELTSNLSPWLSQAQIEGLLERRDRILARARDLVSARGKERVLF